MLNNKALIKPKELKHSLEVNISGHIELIKRVIGENKSFLNKY